MQTIPDHIAGKSAPLVENTSTHTTPSRYNSAITNSPKNGGVLVGQESAPGSVGIIDPAAIFGTLAADHRFGVVAGAGVPAAGGAADGGQDCAGAGGQRAAAGVGDLPSDHDLRPVDLRTSAEVLADAQARVDRVMQPQTPAAQRIMEAARNALPAWDARIAEAEAQLVVLRAAADWSKPWAYRDWEKAERDLAGLHRGRRTAAAMCEPRNLAAEVAEMVSFYGDHRGQR